MAIEDNGGGRNRSEKVGDFVAIYKRGGVWWMNYQNSDGKQVRKSLQTTSKKQAKLLALRKDGELLQGRDSAGVVIATIEDAVIAYDAFLVAEERSPKTLSKYRKVFSRVKTLGDDRKVRDIRGITLSFVDAFRKMRKDAGAKPKTIHNDTIILRQLVNFAVSRDLVDRDPLKGLKLKRPKPTPQPWWTFNQVETILNSLRDNCYFHVYGVLARTGLRIREAKYLTWQDVDFENRVLHVRGKQIDVGDSWKPKGADQRVVPLSPPVIEILQSLPRKARWVFITPSRLSRLAGQPIDERRTLYHLKKALKKLDLPGHQHTFRHSLISHALVSGVPEAVVRKWAGHVDADILKLYTHIADRDSRRYMDQLFNTNGDGGDKGPAAAGDSAENPTEPSGSDTDKEENIQ